MLRSQTLLPPLLAGCTVLLLCTPASAARPAAGARGLPLHFEANRGQVPETIDFVSRGPGYAVWLGPGGVWLAAGRHSPRFAPPVRMSLERARTDLHATAELPLPGVVNDFRGSDPSGWHTGIPTFARVRYAEIRPGVDWVFYGTPKRLEHDLVVAPGVDPGELVLRFDGADAISIDAEGNLALETGGGHLRLLRPVVYQERAGARIPVAGAYELRGAQRVGFAIGAHDPRAPLVIDPIIEYSTFYGGTSAEIGWDIAVDHQGYAYFTGTTNSTNLPVTTGAFDEVGRVGGFSDPGDAFVAKLSPDGTTLEWATYLSGRGLDRLFGIAIDASLDVYVVGDTDSTDDLGTAGVDESYPQVGAAQASFGGVSDMVVTKLDASGASLVYSTYLGGNDVDRGDTENDKPSIDVDSQGRAVVSVVTASSDFQTVAGCNVASPGPYIVRYAADGASLAACVGLGGDEFVFLKELLVDASDRALVVGFTADINLKTTTGTFSKNPLMGEDIILMRTNAAGTAIQAGTYFGDTGDDFANGIAIDASGDVYLTGRSASASYPITIGGPPGGNGVVTKLDGALSSVLWSRAIGFSEGYDIAVDGLERTSTVGTDNQDAAFVHLDANGQQEFETFWGGLLFDVANAVDLDPAGNAYVTGETRSTGFPGDTVQNSSPFQASLSGNRDAWVLKLLRDDPVPKVPLLPGGALGLVVALLGATLAAHVRGRPGAR